MASLKEFIANTTSNIGDRIIDQTLIPTVDFSDVTTLLSNLANRIKAITGAANWKDSPAIDLEQTKAHVDDTNNPHTVTYAQASAIQDAADTVTDSHIGNRTANQATAPTIDTGDLSTLLGWIVNRIKALSGEADWKTDPQTTLAAAMNDTHPANPITGFGDSALALVATQSPGIATEVSRSDHQHPRPTAPEVGAIANTHAANDITGFGVSANVLASFQSPGSSTTVSRGDHQHPYPTASQIGAAAEFGDVNNVFNASSFNANQTTGYGFSNSSGSFTMDSSNGGVRVPVGGDFHIRNTALGYVNCFAWVFLPQSPSLRRTKNDLGAIVDATEKIRGLRGFKYRYVWDDKNAKIQAGFAAEDVKEIFPEAVYSLNGPVGDVPAHEAIGVDYARLSVLALQAIRELDARIAALEAAR